ncbi:outer membrane protein assembly factor BamB [Pseudomonadales bacterium]|nr:outer membrane protein assembly factor BamB [Pseudomonadales bacterium]
MIQLLTKRARCAPSLALSLLLALGGCSWFSDEIEVRVPVELVKFKAEVKLVDLWSVNLGKGAEDSAIKLIPGLVGGRIYAASADGNVVAVDTGTGKVVWKQSIVDFYAEDERAIAFADGIDAITGGVGVGGSLVVVGSAAGEIVALQQVDGSLAWRATTTSEVLAPPQVVNDKVFAQSIDGKIAAFDAASGKRKWLYSTTIPSLTLRGTSTPIADKDFLIGAFANGRMVMLDQNRGQVGFEQRAGIGQGQSDLERLVDIDGQMVLDGSVLYAVAYQGNLVAIDLSAKGQVRWSREASSIVGLGTGFGNIYLASEDSRLTAISKDTTADVWTTEALLYRDITTPVAVSSYVAVGDFEGYLHLIAQSDGRFVGREKLDNAGLTAPVIADGSRIYVISNSGRLLALEVR